MRSLVALVGLTACGSPPPPSPPPSLPVAPAPDACEARVALFQKRLDLLRAPYRDVHGFTAPADDGRQDPDDPTMLRVRVLRTELRYDQVTQPNTPPLDAAIADIQKHLGARRTILIELPTGYHRVDWVLPALIALDHVAELRLLVGRPMAPRIELPTPESPPWARAAYAEVQQGKQRIDDLALKAKGSCAAIDEVYARMANGDSNQAVGELPAAVRRCNCRDMDVDAFELATLAMSNVFGEVQPAWLALHFDDAGTPLELPPKTDLPVWI
jgi:hypothetical protein